MLGLSGKNEIFSYASKNGSLNGWYDLHNAGCIMQVAGHVLWPRAAWLYHGATFFMTVSLLVSGGLVLELNNGYQKSMFYDILGQSFLWRMK